ncbi:MAG: hypothetical protein Q4G19_06615 [Clostridia bacterium]|nr:hypothetical protein [Clostridia bacterium]
MAADTRKTKQATVSKPYMTGSAADGTLLKNALAFLGVWAVCAFMCTIACMVVLPGSDGLRIAFDCIMELIVLMLFYNNGANKGTDAVGRGEIMYQRRENGKPVSDAEQASCYHPAKGFLTGLAGTLPLLILAVMLAVLTERTMTTAGTLPAWLSSYQHRSEVGDALSAYTQVAPATFTDILRMVVRILIMPVVSAIGSENRDGLLLAERLSPLVVLLPAIAYGIGYTRGPAARSQVHTAIAEGKKKLRKRQKKEHRERRQNVARGPEKLN